MLLISLHLSLSCQVSQGSLVCFLLESGIGALHPCHCRGVSLPLLSCPVIPFSDALPSSSVSSGVCSSFTVSPPLQDRRSKLIVPPAQVRRVWPGTAMARITQKRSAAGRSLWLTTAQYSAAWCHHKLSGLAGKPAGFEPTSSESTPRESGPGAQWIDSTLEFQGCVHSRRKENVLGATLRKLGAE